MTTYATFTIYDAIGVKEDVSDVITNISPTKTPFQMGLKSESITTKRHDWQEDALDAAADNAAAEGADAAAAVQTPTSLRTNYTQILTKTVKVTGSMDAASTWGRAKESAYQMSKKMQEIKRDLEFSLVGVSRAATVGSDGVARKMASAPNMIDSTVTTAAGTADLSEAHVLTVLQALYSAGGEADVLMIKPGDAQKVADFAGSNDRSRVVNDTNTTVTNAVHVYISPYGEVKVTLNRFLLNTIAMLYTPSSYRLLSFRPWFREVLAKTGDAQSQMIVGEYSLKHNNFLLSGTITGLT